MTVSCSFAILPNLKCETLIQSFKTYFFIEIKKKIEKSTKFFFLFSQILEQILSKDSNIQTLFSSILRYPDFAYILIATEMLCTDFYC